MKKRLLLLATTLLLASAQPVFASSVAPTVDAENTNDTEISTETSTEATDNSADADAPADVPADSSVDSSDGIIITEDKTMTVDSTEADKTSVLSDNEYACNIQANDPSTITIRYGETKKAVPAVTITLSDGTQIAATAGESYTGDSFELEYEWDGKAFFIHVTKVTENTSFIINSEGAAGYSVSAYAGKEKELLSVDEDTEQAEERPAVNSNELILPLVKIVLLIGGFIALLIFLNKRSAKQQKVIKDGIELPNDEGKTPEDIRAELEEMLKKQKEADARLQAKRMKRIKSEKQKQAAQKADAEVFEVHDVDLHEQIEDTKVPVEKEEEGYTDDELFAGFNDFK